MEHPNLASELALIERALRPEQFRFLVLQYNHVQALAQLRARLQGAFPDRAWRELDARQEGTTGVLAVLQDPPAGLLLLHHIETLLGDAAFTRSLNQRRDALSRHPLGLILLLPTGGDYLHRLSRAMPDLWSLRNLVAELYLPPDPTIGGQFLTDYGKSYFSFNSEAEAQAELARLHTRIAELSTMPGSRQLLSTLLNRQGKIHQQLSEYAAAQLAFEKALTLARETHDQRAETTALTELGDVSYYRGDYETALGYQEQSLVIAREIGDKSGEGTTLNNISQIYDARGDYETALQYLEQSLRIQREIGDKSGEGTTLNNLATTAHARGDYETALQYLEQCLTLFREIGAKYEEGGTLNNISQIYAARGDYETALQYLEQSLRIRREIGDINGLAVALNNMAVIVFQQQGKPEEALPLFLQSYQIFQQIGSPNEKVPRSYLEKIRQQIGEARFHELLAEWQAQQQ